jgi:DNA-binding transcriptional MerR regulator
MMDDQESTTRQLSARELAEHGNTTVRTVHYYVSEGLLPPPEGATRNALYGRAHLARLRIISALREEGLSLAAIRSRLARLNDERVIGVLETLDRFEEDIAAGEVTALGLIEATLVDEPNEVTTLADMAPDTRMMMSTPSPPEESSTPQSARAYVERVLSRSDTSPPGPTRRDAPVRPTAPTETWHHFTIDDGIEIRIREDRLRADRRQIEAFVQTIRDLARRSARHRDDL